MKPTFKIHALRTIVVGTELGSFARAAVQLGRSQSAVEMQLKRLEEQAGHSLFQRAGRDLSRPRRAMHCCRLTRAGSSSYTMRRPPLLGTTAAAASIVMGMPQDFLKMSCPMRLRASRDGDPAFTWKCGPDATMRSRTKWNQASRPGACVFPGRARQIGRVARIHANVLVCWEEIRNVPK